MQITLLQQNTPLPSIGGLTVRKTDLVSNEADPYLSKQPSENRTVTLLHRWALCRACRRIRDWPITLLDVVKCQVEKGLKQPTTRH